MTAAEAGLLREKTPVLRYQTTPHAPLSRRQEQIEGSLLFAVESHQLQQRYRGGIFCETALIQPLLPLGGKGKFTSAEAQVVQTTTSKVLQADLVGNLPAAGQPMTIELLTPMIFQAAGWGQLAPPERVQVKSPRRYRAWRTGLYPNATTGGRQEYGIQPDETQPFRVGQASAPAAGWPEGSRFGYTCDATRAAQIAKAFVAGAGRADWACLGWGQLFVHLALQEGARV